MTEPPMDPDDATTQAIADMAEVMARILAELIGTGRMTLQEASALLDAELLMTGPDRSDRVRRTLLRGTAAQLWPALVARTRRA